LPTRGALTATALGEPRTEGCAGWGREQEGGSLRGLGGGGGGGDGDGGCGAGGWLVGRFGGGCIGVVPSVRRQEGHSHTGRIRPHQSILRVQGHRPTNYPGLIDARRRRKKPGPSATPLPVTCVPPKLCFTRAASKRIAISVGNQFFLEIMGAKKLLFYKYTRRVM